MRNLAAAVALSLSLMVAACDSNIGQIANSQSGQVSPVVKAYDLDAMIAISAGQHGWEETIKQFTGKKVEFRFLPDRYDGAMGNRVLASSNSAATCPVDESTFLRVQSRHSRFIVIRGVIAPFSVDTPVKLEDCEVVKLDTDGWEPDASDGQTHKAPPTPSPSASPSMVPIASAEPQPIPASANDFDTVRFDSYKAEVFGGGDAASPILIGGNPPNKSFKSALNEAIMSDPNYAGSYSVVRLGCGNQCEFIKFVNQKNGVVVDLPSELQPNPHDIAHMNDSRLLKITTYIDQDLTQCRFDDLVMENDRFKDIAHRTGACPAK